MDESKQQKQLDFMLVNILKFGKFSYSLQEKCERILIDQSSRLLTAYSIATAAFLIPISNAPVAAKSALLLGLMLSLIFPTIAGWRFKYDGMPSVDAFYEDVYNHYDKYENQCQFDGQWKSQISKLHKSKKRLNDIRTWCILLSMVLFIFAISAATIYLVIFL